MKGCCRDTTSTAIYREIFRRAPTISNAVAVANLVFYFVYQCVTYATAFLSSGSVDTNPLNPFENILLPLFWNHGSVERE